MLELNYVCVQISMHESQHRCELAREYTFVSVSICRYIIFAFINVTFMYV